MMKFVIFPMLLVLNGTSIHAETARTPVKENAKRIEVRITKAQRARFKDLSESLGMASMTPIVNDDDEVICMSIGEIKDKIVSQTLLAKVGDCFTDVKIFKKSATGKMESESISVLSVADSMNLYQSLAGASRVDVDLKRNHKTVPMTYLID